MDGRRFLLEAFEPASGAGDAEGSAARLERAADELAREGIPIVYRRTIRVTADETSFHLLDATGEAAIEAAAQRARIHVIRVVAAEESVAAPGGPARPR